MSITPNLVFFNKEGYPYNFTLNDGIWTGKIFFQPGSTDIFKSLTLYTLESVNPIEYTGVFDIVNKEIFNDSGMTLSPGDYTNQQVTDILSVNQSPAFHTKWIYGDNFHRYFPKGTVISFSGDTLTGVTTGEMDFREGYYFVVLQTVKDAIMISTTTSNDTYSFIFDSSIYDFKVTAYDCISVPDADQNLQYVFNIGDNEKVSVVGSNDADNDGIYEVLSTGYTTSRVFDFNLNSGVTTGTTFNDLIVIDLTLLTERPLLYSGQFDMSYDGARLLATFPGGRNSNIDVGTVFICEDSAMNYLLFANEYTVTEVITENYITTATGMTFSGYTYEEDDGTLEYIYTLTMAETFGIEIGWQLRFDSAATYDVNNRVIKTITDITSGVTTVGETGITFYDFTLDSAIMFETGTTYSITQLLPAHEQNTVIVTSSIDNSTYDGFARVLSTTNVLRYVQQIPTITGGTLNDAIDSALDSFIIKYTNVFVFNGIDIYRKQETLIFDGRYAGSYKPSFKNPYFDVNLNINHNNILTPILITSGYSINLSGDTFIYDIILKPSNIVYERANMSNNLSRPFQADVLMDLSDDSQDYGFQLQVNGVQYYISFNNIQIVPINSGDIYTIPSVLNRIDLKYIGAINTTATVILSGISYVIKSIPNYLIWDFGGVGQHSFDFVTTGDTISITGGTPYTIRYDINNSALNIEKYSGTTDTIETIRDFTDKYYNAFSQNGLNIFSGVTLSGLTLYATLTVEGQEPNVHVYEFKVKVNRNSTYILNQVSDRSMMVTANKLVIEPSMDVTNLGFATGMILSVSGSTYPLNNKEFNIIGITQSSNNFYDQLELSYQGPMSGETNVTLSLKTREFLRRPRETNDSDIKYRYRWEDDLTSAMFLYDLSGDNLVPWGDNPLYAYTGPKPLVANYDLVFLNKQPNKSTDFVNIPYKQQTVFDQLDFTLERFDSDDVSILPHPITTFIGYNNTAEGTDQRNMIVERVDNIVFSGSTQVDINGHSIGLYFNVSGNAVTQVSGNTSQSFLEQGFKTSRYVRMKFNDNKPYTQEIFEDYHDYLILNVTNTTLQLSGALTPFTTLDQDFDYEFLLLPEQIAYFRLYGETEAEDERLEATMKLLGVSLTEEDEFIFKQSDVTEDGIDYRLLNRKRKEMMNVYPEIYNYVGSYRAILNAISFFGYNDIQLMEYYRNIRVGSPYYNKLKRVVIPDLLDRTIEGWTYSEPNPNPAEYVKTNLFNLTYRITDEEGNNVYLYTLKEVQTKLNGLKHWLRRNVIPVNSNIRDITGVSEVVDTNYRRFDPGTNFTKNVVEQSNEAVNINYTATRNFNDNWLVSARFYTISGEVPTYWDLKVITFKKDPVTGILYPQQRWDDQRFDLSNFNFSINWDGTATDYDMDRFFYVETTRYNDQGVGKTLNKMYRLEDGIRFYFDEFKNYTLVNNNFRYKTFPYIQNVTDVYIIDEFGNFWIINKAIQAAR